MITLTLVLIIIFALIYNLANGWNDAAGAIATVISTRVLSPTKSDHLWVGPEFLWSLVLAVKLLRQWVQRSPHRNS